MNEVKRKYWENGQLSHEYPYVDGKAHGLCRRWRENGQLWSIDLYNNGAHVCEWQAKGQHSIDITKLSFR